MNRIRHTRASAPMVAALLAALVVLLAACGGQAGAPGGGGDGADREVPAADLDGLGDQRAPSEDGGEPVTAGEDGYAALIEQRVIKTGEITLEVDNVGTALGEVRALATGLGGYVGGSQAGTLDDRATLTLRIPADRFDDAIAAIHELDADVVAESTREQDVTGQIVDLEARIENLAASEATYRELVARATEIDDILAVQSRLDDVRGQIEQLRAQLENVAGQADLSTLTVALVPVAAPVTAKTEAWDPGAQVDAAVAALVGLGQGLLTGLIWIGVVILPIAIVAGVVVFVAVRSGLLLRRRLPTAESGSE